MRKTEHWKTFVLAKDLIESMICYQINQRLIAAWQRETTRHWLCA
jgi:hypothetical protein